MSLVRDPQTALYRIDQVLATTPATAFRLMELFAGFRRANANPEAEEEHRGKRRLPVEFATGSFTERRLAVLRYCLASGCRPFELAEHLSKNPILHDRRHELDPKAVARDMSLAIVHAAGECLLG